MAKKYINFNELLNAMPDKKDEVDDILDIEDLIAALDFLEMQEPVDDKH